MRKLAEMREKLPMELHRGAMSTTTDVWSMLCAANHGDLETIKSLGSKCDALLWCQYDYTTPMQLAVKEGHFDVVRYLVEKGALDRDDRNHPFLEPLLTLARDRGFEQIADYLTASLSNPELTHERGDCGRIDRGTDEENKRFQAAVDRGDTDEARSMLTSRPDLARDEQAFWGEGILAIPCKGADRPMIDLLFEFGASVPKLSKWGARYYFKHYEIAKLLLENGMDPNHSNWREFTLLHDMAFTGDVEKAKLLIEYGADVDEVDEEYHSTPLGYAAHFGQLEIVELLLEYDADPNPAGREWAKPLALARMKCHTEIEEILLTAGAA